MDVAIYFTTVTTNSGFAIPEYQADPQDFVNRVHAAGKKATFAVGGWTGSRYFSTLVDSSSKRTALANQMKAFQDKYGFDGVDLDWEYMNQPGIGESLAVLCPEALACSRGSVSFRLQPGIIRRCRKLFVLFDNAQEHPRSLQNHLGRRECQWNHRRRRKSSRLVRQLREVSHLFTLDDVRYRRSVERDHEPCRSSEDLQKRLVH